MPARTLSDHRAGQGLLRLQTTRLQRFRYPYPLLCKFEGFEACATSSREVRDWLRWQSFDARSLLVN